jgi:hypothetical protein
MRVAHDSPNAEALKPPLPFTTSRQAQRLRLRLRTRGVSVRRAAGTGVKRRRRYQFFVVRALPNFANFAGAGALNVGPRIARLARDVAAAPVHERRSILRMHRTDLADDDVMVAHSGESLPRHTRATRARPARSGSRFRNLLPTQSR